MALVSYGPTMGDPNLGNIFGDAWSYIKKEPLVLIPPLWVGQKTLQAVPGILQTAKGEVQKTIAPFRPPAPPSQVDALTSALGLSGGSSGALGGEPGSSSMLPIILGAGALGLVLVLALGKKKKPA